MSNFDVSVIVAAFNKEDVLSRCIDSLIYQTLENTEIILVDDFSTDNSWNIMMEYQKKFSDRVCVVKSEKKGMAYAKNAGIGAAQGRYIAFLDASDYMDYKLLNKLYSFAKKNNFPELVYSPITSVNKGQMEKEGILTRHGTKEDYLMGNGHFLRGKLFRADVFVNYGMFPDVLMGEESCFVFTVISHMETMAYIPVYEYYHERTEISENTDEEILSFFDEIIKGSDYIIEKTNPEYQKYGVIFALLRVYNLAQDRPKYMDIFQRYLKTKWTYLESIENLACLAPEIYEKYMEQKVYGAEIPKKIYLNGFAYHYDEREIANVSKAFRDTSEIVILKESNCDLVSCPVIVSEAYRAKNMDFVGKYFALKACYDAGGIFIDGSLEIDNPLTPMLDNPCFFCFESDDIFTDRIFGACSGNVCVQKILRTYETENWYEERFASLGQRIKTVMIGMYSVEMQSSLVKKMNYGIVLYPAEMFICRLPWETGYYVSHYKEFSGSESEISNMPKRVLVALVNSYLRREIEKQNIDRVKKDREFLAKKSKKLERGIETLEETVQRQKKDIAFLKNKTEMKVKDVVFLKNKTARLEKEVEFWQDKSARQDKLISRLNKAGWKKQFKVIGKK